MTVPVITQIPTPPLRGDAPSDFATKADNFAAALPQFVTETNTSASFVNQRAADAAGSATAAAASEAAVEADRAEVASNAATVASQTATVVARADEVAANTLQVAANTQQAAISAQIAVNAAAGIADGPVTSVNGQTGVVTLAFVRLNGDPAPYVTQTKTYTITNYSAFSVYSATVSAGSASIAGDTITFTAPPAAGNVTLTVTMDGVAQAFTINVQPASVATPTITSPANGATGVIETPEFVTGAFESIGIADNHLNTDWELWTGANRTGTLVWSSLANTANKTSITLPAGVMSVSTTYHLSVRHRGTTLGASAWASSSFTTAATFNSYIPTPTATPSNFGGPLDGGFYAGMVWGQVAQSSSSKTLATGTQSFAVPSMTGAPIVYAGQTLEVRSRASPANKFIGTVTGATGTTLTLNVTSIGGSGTFSDWSVMARHRVIVAPKASGEHAGITLKNASTAFPTACQTLTEGLVATEAMKNADTSTAYPAAHWARGLSIGGRTDWYIPARDELELCWRNLKPVTNSNYVTADRPTGASFNYANNGSAGDTSASHGVNNNSSPTGAAYTASNPAQTAATAFRSGGAEAFEFGTASYWSCSEYSASIAWFQYWDSSYPGYQYGNNKANTLRVRAVRRSII